MIVHIEELDIIVEYDYTPSKYAEIVDRIPTECDTEEYLEIHTVTINGIILDFYKDAIDHDYIYEKTLEQIYKNGKNRN